MMKKKRNPFLRRLNKDEEDIVLPCLNRVAIIETTIETDPDHNIELSADIKTDATVSPAQEEAKDEKVRIVSPEKCQDDYSLFIVHNYVNGEITGNSKIVDDSLSGMSTRTSSAGRLTEFSRAHCPSLYEPINDYIPTEVRSFTSFNNKEKVNNSLIDDDISAISFDKMLKLQDRSVEESVEDASCAVRNTKSGCAMAKEHMIENMLSFKYARRRRDRRMKVSDDETYATFDIDEWEKEFGGGCCYTQQLDGIIMETGKAVHDWAGELDDNDYPLGGQLVSICDGGSGYVEEFDKDI